MSQNKRSRSSVSSSEGGSARSTPARSRPSPHGSPRDAPARSRGRNVRGPDTNVSRTGRELCNYTHRVCLQNRLEGYEFCIRHILVDKSAPFKQCHYVHPSSNKRCPNAARRLDRHPKDNAFCPWHIKKMYLKRRQSELSIHRIKESEQTLASHLKNLEHYCPEPHVKRRRNDDWVKQDDDTTTATDEFREKIGRAASSLNESDSDDEINNPLIDDSLRADLIDSDSESIESDQEDPLKHAGVYTAEEASCLLAEKMHKLQKLYIDQFKHLRWLMKEKFRKYYLDSLNESVNFSSTPTETDIDQYRAMLRYHKYHGKELLLKRQVKEKRKAITEGRNYQPPVYPTCIFTKEEEACKNRSLPATHYCKKHILYDVQQVLFRPCANGQPPCLNPVVSFVHNNACLLHSDLKADKSVLNKEDDSTSMGTSAAEPELFRVNVDDIASLQLDDVVPTTFFALDQYANLGNSTNTI